MVLLFAFARNQGNAFDKAIYHFNLRNAAGMRPLDEVFAALQKSSFRKGFRLRAKELAYLQQKGLPLVMQHADDFIGKRLSPADIPNDGKQTPFRGHPVFIAQHATACCCRQCLEKWHRSPRGRALDADEERYVMTVLERWLRNELDVAHPELF